MRVEVGFELQNDAHPHLFPPSLFILRQALVKGYQVRPLVFAGGSPFLVDMESLGSETISIANLPREILRLDIKIQSAKSKKGKALEHQHKLRFGTP